MNLRRWILIVAVPALASVALAQRAPGLGVKIDKTLNDAVTVHKVPNVVAIVVKGDKAIYSGAYGPINDTGGPPVSIDTIYRIASMTKPVTAVAAMQLVEAGKLGLDEPAAKYLPLIGEAKVLDRMDETTGEPVLRAPKTPVTIRQLLSHTSGFVYDRWDAKMHAYRTKVLAGGVTAADFKDELMFDPGTRWQYGTSTMWLGRVVEAVSGQTLEQYFQEHIFAPLGMKDSSFIVPESKADRLITLHQRGPEGSFAEVLPNRRPNPPTFDGGSALTSTPRDYATFIEMIINDGEWHGGRILKATTVHDMEKNQIGDLMLHPFVSTNQAQSVDGGLPGGFDKFGLGFAISTKGEAGGLPPGTVAWAGLMDTFFWIDPRTHIGGVIMFQILPFLDPAPIGVLREFEHDVYSAPLPR
jgi:methyl acetate hydrolase